MRSNRYLEDAILCDSDCPWRDDLSAKTRCRSDGGRCFCHDPWVGVSHCARKLTAGWGLYSSSSFQSEKMEKNDG